MSDKEGLNVCSYRITEGKSSNDFSQNPTIPDASLTRNGVEKKKGPCDFENLIVETSKSSLARPLDSEKLKACQECGVCTGGCPVAWMVPNYYNPRQLLQRSVLDFRQISQDVGLWLCARCYRCYNRCPQMLDLPQIFSTMRSLAIELGYLSDPLSKLDEALKIIEEEISLSAVYAWLSLYPYELDSKHKEADKFIIKKLQSFLASRKAKKPTTTTATQSEKIAIVGSGPAGLTAACELVKRGYSVTVFESLPFPGGMLRVGIPDYRLSKEALEADLGYIKGLGVEIRTNVMVGRDVTIDGLLKEKYGAIFIAIGAHKSVNIDIEGRELGGVFQALDLFRKLHMGERINMGQKVAVIGGGNVAIDAARTALRLGAKEVNVLYRRSRIEMPASPSEVKEAEMEGAKIHFLVTPTRILGNDNRIEGVKCIHMQLGALDETGRRRPIPIDGSDYTLDVDTVILAIGETSDLSFLPKDVTIVGKNTIAVDPMTMETSSPKMYAGGDVVSGPASVVDALAAGKRAADSIDRQLRGETRVG